MTTSYFLDNEVTNVFFDKSDSNLKCFTFTTDTACITGHAQTISKYTKDNTVLFYLRDLIRHFHDHLGH